MARSFMQFQNLSGGLLFNPGPGFPGRPLAPTPGPPHGDASTCDTLPVDPGGTRITSPRGDWAKPVSRMATSANGSGRTGGIEGAMLVRRIALGIGLLLAVAFSQVPEFVQQYRQRLGGAVDELKRIVAQFDAEVRAQSLSREAGIARLRANADPLAQARGMDVQLAVDRERRLETQQRDFDDPGPLGRYWVFAERFDPELAGQTYAVFQPAVPVTNAGFVSGACGLVLGYGGVRVAASPFRRRRRAVALA